MVIQDPLVAAGAFSVPTSLEPSVGKQTSATVVQLDQLDALVSQVNRKLGAEQQLADPAMCWSRGERFSQDYNNLVSPVDTVNMIPLPDFLLRQIDNAECRCFMGLLPEIHRVWLTVDHRLFLWNYEDNSDFYSYEGMTDILVSVQLLVPKKGVFEDHIQYLLALVSQSEVRLLGVAFSKAGELSMYMTQISVPTDGIVMLSANALSTGQLLLGGQDGHLYELEYEAEESWFRRRCSLKNLTKSRLSVLVPAFLSLGGPNPLISLQVDEPRGLLYALFENSDIEVFALSKVKSGNEEGLFKIGSVCRKNVIDEAKNYGSRNSATRFDKDAFRVLTVGIIPQTQATGQLASFVAISVKGIRIYFNVARSNGFINLQIAHIRSMPSLEDEKDIDPFLLPMTQFDTALYFNGLFLLAGASAQMTNILFASSVDTGSLIKRRGFTEFSQIQQSPERIWTMSPVSLSSQNAFAPDWWLMNDLTSQTVSPPQMFLILTNQALYTLIRKRPFDHFIQILTESRGQDSDLFRRFAENYTDEQLAAMSLAIACDNSFACYGANHNISGSNSQIRLWATRCFLEIAPRTINAASELGKFAITPDGPQNIGYHSALLYLARLISPFWFTKLSAFDNTPNVTETLTLVIEGLMNLRLFLSQTYLQTLLNVHQQNEKHALDSLLQLIELCAQGSQFILVLLSSKPVTFFARITPPLRPFAETCTFGALVSSKSGFELVREFTKLLLNDIITQNNHIDSMCQYLQDKCPFFFNADDVKIYKAKEWIQNAKTVPENNPTLLIDRALRSLMEASRSISASQLKILCESFKSLGVPEELGAVRLGLCCAQQSDALNIALKVYLGGEMPAEQSENVRKRIECYQCVFEIIDEIIDTLASETSIEVLEKTYRYSPIFREVFQSNDEYFQYIFFDHMLERKQLVHVLKLTSSPFLEKYLERKQFEKSEFGLYLCLLYRNLKKYDRAVMKLHEFAVSPRFPATLEKRIEMISMASSIAESKVSVSISPELGEELRDLVDVANVQFELYKIVESKYGPNNRYLMDLDRNLLNVTEIYRIAEELRLPVIKLGVLFVSSHRDEQLLQNIWREILEQESTVEGKYNQIISVGQKFAHSELIMPLSLIVPLLEQEALHCKDEPDPLWIAAALKQAGYSFAEILLAYDSLISEKRPPFHNNSALIYMMDKQYRLIVEWFSDSMAESGLFDGKLVDEKVSNYKSFLCTLTDGRAQELYDSFIELEKDLRRN